MSYVIFYNFPQLVDKHLSVINEFIFECIKCTFVWDSAVIDGAYCLSLSMYIATGFYHISFS